MSSLAIKTTPLDLPSADMASVNWDIRSPCGTAVHRAVQALPRSLTLADPGGPGPGPLQATSPSGVQAYSYATAVHGAVIQTQHLVVFCC